MKFEKFISLDLELNQPSGKIIQIGVCVGSQAQATGDWVRKTWYIDPGEPIAAAITQLTGISDEDIRTHAVSHADVARELSALIQDHACFVNPVTWGGGDAAELLQEFKTAGVEFQHFGRRWIDVKTWYVFLMLAQGRSPQGGLASAMSRFKLAFQGRAHQADVDAFNTLRFFFHLLERQQGLEHFLSWSHSRAGR